MLHFTNPLYFPILIRTGETQFKSWSESAKSTNLYKLDWLKSEQIKIEHFDKWKKTSDSIYAGDLPENWDEWLKNFTFAIPSHYMSSIKHFTLQGLMAWNYRASFDTNIREICLKPAISSIEVAFKLIGDCLYDPETNYFYRGEDKIIFSRAALYKFWNHQTGRGLLERNADFEVLELMLKNKKQIAIETFLSDIKEFNDKLTKAYKLTCCETEESTSGPSLGEKKS